MFVRVAVLTERGALPELYTYELARDIADAPVGACVVVPFQTRVYLGYIIEHLEVSDVEHTRAVIARYPSGDVAGDRVELAQWMAERWFSSMSACLRMMVPPALRGRIVRKIVAVEGASGGPSGIGGQILATLRENGPTAIEVLYKSFGKETAQRALLKLRKEGLVRDTVELSIAAGAVKTEAIYQISDREQATEWLESFARKRPKQAIVLTALLDSDIPLTAHELQTGQGDPRPSLKQLETAGVVAKAARDVLRHAKELISPRTGHTLSEDQERTLQDIDRCIASGEREELLIFGVTASGKTEVYLRTIARVLEAGKTALILMPEIALTVHAVSQFRNWFAGRLAVLHSRLSSGERADEWRRIQSGEATVVLGPRSAVFAPLKDIGVIIMDEEHESAFKQDSDPRYHARDICEKLTETYRIPLILGSATPSVETFYKFTLGEISMTELPSRIDDRPLPEVEVVDMRGFARDNALTVLSHPLREALTETVEKDGQVILFLNRRAYGTFIMCRECGYVANCPNCAVSTKYHRTDHSMRCHHCDWKAPVPRFCPSCKGTKIASFGVGTQRVEEELFTFMPSIRVLRMDRDTTSRKDSVVDIIGRFRAHEADVLIGTQIVAKGLDFPGVLLVGVINADTGLHMPDFRAAERGFQLLTQVAGRAGRGERAGRVVIQTFQPYHYSIEAAATHDFRRFYEDEIPARQELKWPPFGSVARVLIRAVKRTDCIDLAHAIANQLNKVNADGRVDILGPSAAPVERLKARFRWHLMLRCERREDIFSLLEAAGARSWKGAEISIDIDPLTMM
ncbi:MAG: primosomal protein N' [Armatimonadota bacterium]